MIHFKRFHLNKYIYIKKIVIYIKEYNTKCYGVIFLKNGCVKVPKIEDISNHENNILYIKPLKPFLGKIEVCDMTKLSGFYDRELFDRNTNILKISEENDKHRFVYIGGDKLCSFLTDDDVYKNISNMGINLTPYSIAIGEQNVYFLTP